MFFRNILKKNYEVEKVFKLQRNIHIGLRLQQKKKKKKAQFKVKILTKDNNASTNH